MLELEQKQLIEELIDVYKDDYNIFRILKNGDHEIRHSSFLSWLMDSKENHGFGNAFLKRFLVVCMDEKRDILSCCGLVPDSVKTSDDNHKKVDEIDDEIIIFEEYPVPMKGAGKRFTNKRIDILMVGKDYTCTIENKYGSVVHDDQLQRYKTFVECRDSDNFAPFKYSKRRNLFVYLDIPEIDKLPVYLRAVHKDMTGETIRKTYSGYNYVSYRDIISILKDLCDEDYQKNNAEQYKFIKQYIDLVSEKYGEYSGIISDKLNELMNKYDHLSDSHFEKEYVDNPKHRDVLDRFKDYTRMVQSKNDDYIEGKLKDLFKNNDSIKMHYGKAEVTNPYAYKYLFDKETAFSQYIGQIDFPAKYGRYSMALYGGLSSNQTSENCIDYFMNNSKEVRTKLAELGKYNWNCYIEYCIYSSTGQGLNQLPEIKEYNRKIEMERFLEMAEVYLKNKFEGNYSKEESLNVSKALYVGTFKKDKLFKDGKLKKDFCDLLDNFFSGYKGDLAKSIEQSIISKDREQITCRWCFGMVRQFDELNAGKAIITDADRKNISNDICKLYRDTINTGLTLFGFDKNKLNELFK
ncbi:MAG: PD-(D/E)XK nuclease family protein [Lachnospiraceae bacterium]|nr:PD-(D/E)XK nuclease family protein [Lachnospiraceae bacterium]